MSKKAVMYVHIPFCASKTALAQLGSIYATSETKHLYMEALEQELLSTESLLRDYSIAAVCIGGGSPSVMRPDDISGFLREVRRHANLERGAEISMEAIPQTIGTPCLGGMKSGGVNRISLRMLSALDKELSRTGCGFTLGDIQNATAFIARFGFRNVSLSIACGLPEQNEHSMERSLRAALTCDPDHITLEKVQTHAQTPEFENGRLTIAARLVETAASYLQEAGFRRYTTFCFARPGKESKYLTSRLEGCDVIGLGLGAVSLAGDHVCVNTTSLETYLHGAGSCAQVVHQAGRLTSEQRSSYIAACQQLTA